jgi:hypothetical protein
VVKGAFTTLAVWRKARFCWSTGVLLDVLKGTLRTLNDLKGTFET